MNKIINPGSVLCGSRWGRIYIKIRYNDGKLSISGVEGPLSSGNCLGSCGQIVMSYNPRSRHYSTPPKQIKFNAGWNAGRWLAFISLWDKWHLNDLTAGCPHQEAHLQEHPELSRDYEELIKLPLFAKCPHCNYAYGTSWLRTEVPTEVIDQLESLPETKHTPAWI